jgi:hypothetical protein
MPPTATNSYPDLRVTILRPPRAVWLTSWLSPAAMRAAAAILRGDDVGMIGAHPSPLP